MATRKNTPPNNKGVHTGTSPLTETDRRRFIQFRGTGEVSPPDSDNRLYTFPEEAGFPDQVNVPLPPARKT
ncbi:MAG: hypothetical protein J5531_01125, partial [Lachnospiraceae bacterium]|nr:hypothetical protein [Lachnospiraceae bacterium]